MISDCFGFGTCDAIKELPDWKVEERERGMIDLKMGFFHLSWILDFLLATTSHQKGGKIHSS